MAKKGVIADIFSMALYHDKPDLYIVGYLDFGTIKEVTLREFLEISEDFQAIPATRIYHIRKGDKILYSKQVAKKRRNSV